MNCSSSACSIWISWCSSSGSASKAGRDTAAADDGISHGVNDVAADGADIQFGAEQIGGRILVDERHRLSSAP